MGDLRRAAAPRNLSYNAVAIVIAAALLLPDDADAQKRRRYIAPDPVMSLGERMNSNTISIIAGNVNGTYLTIAYDLAAVLNDGDDLRILPVIGKGGGQNIRDVRFLRGIDLGITQANILDIYRRTGQIGPIDDKITYITKLFNEEMHIVVRSDITSLEQLRGQKVSFNESNSATHISGRDIFERLGLKVEELTMGQADGLQALKTGKIAAMMQMTAKPTRAIAGIIPSDGFRLLPVPFAKSLQDVYLPARLTHEDYPQLIAPGKSIDAVGASGILIAYNWPQDTERYRRLAKFVESFFPRIAEFQKPPRHPKWRETNLAATIPGWKRFPAAEEWLQRNHEVRARPAVRQKFEQFLARSGSAANAFATPEEREKLFQEFINWSQGRDSR
jgi:TRAP transporter TAXI family solute receptor